jgi:hypothetical protein
MWSSNAERSTVWEMEVEMEVLRIVYRRQRPFSTTACRATGRETLGGMLGEGHERGAQTSTRRVRRQAPSSPHCLHKRRLYLVMCVGR